MSERKEKALAKLKQQLLFRGFSPKTIKSYMYNSDKFLSYLDKTSQKCNEKSVRLYFQKIPDKIDLSIIRLK